MEIPENSIAAQPELDQAVIAILPPNCKVLSVTPLTDKHRGTIRTAKIVVQPQHGHDVNAIAEYFIKTASGPAGAEMMRSAFEADHALYKFLSAHVPQPIGWGTYSSTPSESHTHFYLSEFVAMRDDSDDHHSLRPGVDGPRAWACALAGLHRNSMGNTPAGRRGMFGFHVDTYIVDVPMDNAWTDSWEGFWARQMRGLFAREEEQRLAGDGDGAGGEENKVDDEFEELKRRYFEEAVPRYLRPLESEGRQVEACLIHSDLYPGNVKPRASPEGGLWVYNACAFWGHNEADLGVCRIPRYKLGQACIDEYLMRVPVSEPEEDFDGRNAVYAMKYHVLLSSMYPRDANFRRVLVEELRALVEMVEADKTVAHW
ncbi:Fructosamine kinase-domain-containing protein [Podospora didyma]|uniref:protein-ribulosamine 3-kinase n=1 Tax=Podospora didyma TaxID=330526 RepID=A0AAE0U1D6_9PEZI|nr:Fructosamine kinase-domain-containing protein [Podospora didyma]